MSNDEGSPKLKTRISACFSAFGIWISFVIGYFKSRHDNFQPLVSPSRRNKRPPDHAGEFQVLPQAWSRPSSEYFVLSAANKISWPRSLIPINFSPTASSAPKRSPKPSWDHSRFPFVASTQTTFAPAPWL